jgi:hypothetical protein
VISDVFTSSATKRPLFKVSRAMEISKGHQLVTSGLNSFRTSVMQTIIPKFLNYKNISFSFLVIMPVLSEYFPK